MNEKDIMPLNYFKKEPFTGSEKGMRYRIEMVEEEEKKYLKATVWPQPFSYECTDEALMIAEKWPYSEESRQLILPWLLAEYENRREMYEKAAKL